MLNALLFSLLIVIMVAFYFKIVTIVIKLMASWMEILD
jgi:hypothetical protein